jgi:hypothetical protein
VGALAALGGFALSAVFIASRPARDATSAQATSAQATSAAPATARSTPGPAVTPVLDAPLAAAGPPGRVTPTASVPVAAKAPSAAPNNKPKRNAPERQRGAADTARTETGVASSLHLSTREP